MTTKRKDKAERKEPVKGALQKLLPANTRNPRKISTERKQVLRRAIDEFGDLGGIVFNRKTNRLVGGHQRIDRPLVLPTSRRVVLTPDRYRATLVPHLLYQAGGNISFDRFRKAYWLLTEPGTLARYATGAVGDIARGWGRTFKDRLEKDRFIEHLKGAMGRQLHFIHKDGERWLELREPNVADDEHVIFDARLALLVADLWPVAEPITPLAPAEEITIQELEAVL